MRLVVRTSSWLRSRGARQVIALTVLGFATFRATASYVVQLKLGGEPFQTGDWFINYSGGFVRRGLFGYLLFKPGLSPTWTLLTLALVQFGCYALTYAAFLQFLRRSDWSWVAIAMVCGPAGLSFIGYDVLGGFRKEILAFAVMAILLQAGRSARRSTWLAWTAVAGVGWVLAVFSWEGVVFMLPALAFLILLPARGEARRATGIPAAWKWSALAVFTLIGGVGALAAAKYSGSHDVMLTICESVRARHLGGENICAGGISALDWTMSQSIDYVARSFPMYYNYLPLLLLAVLPFLTTEWFRRQWPWFLLLFLGTLPLYVIAIDYGRWIHILVIEAVFCFIASPGTERERPSAWNWLATCLYVGAWGLPRYVQLGSPLWTPFSFASAVADLNNYWTALQADWQRH